MKKVLILNWRDPLNPLAGGAEKVTLKYAEQMTNSGYEVTWLAGGYSNAPRVQYISGIKIFRFSTPILIYLFAPFIYWIKFKGNFDLVIDEIHGIPFLTPIWAFNSKKIVFIHEVAQEIWHDMLAYPFKNIGKVYEQLYFKIFYQKAFFLTVSPSTQKDLKKFGVPPKNILVIPNGSDIKPIKRVPNKSSKLSFVVVSRLVKMKGIEEAIKIFSKVNAKNKNSKMHIVGKGNIEYIFTLKSLVKKLKLSKSVVFHGYVSQSVKIQILQMSHFLINTSVREGFGLVILEANSQGTPVIVFDNPGLRDIVFNDINGYKFSSTTSKTKIANKIINIIDDKKRYDDLVISSIAFTKKFDWNKSLVLFNNLIKKTFNEK